MLAAGPVSVMLAPGLAADSDNAGVFNWRTRTIKIDSHLEMHAAYLTLWHEWVHAVFEDAGLTMEHELLERICNRIAEARVFEMLQK